MKARTAVGIRAFKAALGAGATGPYVELLNFESIDGGGVKNNSESVTTATKGVTEYFPTTQEYSDITINVPNDVGDTAFPDSLVNILDKAARDKEEFDLVRMIPAGGGKYETFVYSGFINDANPGSKNSTNLQKSKYTFKVSNMKLFTGTISDGEPSLTPYTE